MVLLGITNLLMRWLFSVSIIWVDIQLRQMVLWIGLLGSVLAAAKRRHIRIDLIDHFFSEQSKLIINRVTSILSAAGSFYLGCISIGFILSEREAGLALDRIMFSLSMPLWIVELIIPVGFFLMSLFFAASSIFPVTDDPEGVQQR